MDNLTPEQRRYTMFQVKSSNTKPEMFVRSLLHRLGYRFRLHRDDLPGKPDIVLPKYKSVIFVHGCFWHRHENCKHATMPKSNVEYWEKKFARNVARDKWAKAELELQGWRVVVVWECELREVESLVDRLERTLRDAVSMSEPFAYRKVAETMAPYGSKKSKNDDDSESKTLS